MSELTATWKKLSSSSILERSSHTVSVVGNKVYIFGGELYPREPRDNAVHIIDVKIAEGTLESAVSTLPPTSDSPSSRVGSASTILHGNIYLFSGRGGVALTCYEEKGSFWVYNSVISSWSIISPSDPTLPYPEARSYHTLANNGKETLYLHAGCPAKGRLSDLWSFHIHSKRWTQLSSAPEPARGGTSIAFSREQLYRMNGFDGTTEQGGTIDVYNIEKKTWSSLPFHSDGKFGPGPRSVSCLLAIDLNDRPSLVTMFGEQDPSSLGHAGAGKMLNDIWVYDLWSNHWTKAVTGHDEEPAARGWFDADVIKNLAKTFIVVHGGLDDSNKRLGDVWLLKL